MNNISEIEIVKNRRPVRAVQFGEGNFLRAFADYMIDILNEKSDFNGSVAVLKPIEYGSVEQFKKQNNLYTVYLRGFSEGRELIEKRIVTSIETTLSCFEDYSSYAELARLDTLRFVISNTTEAGIVLDTSDSIELCPPKTYPGKLTKFLYERFTYFNGDKSKGLIMLPVELIDNNGTELKKCVKELTKAWGLSAEFTDWLDSACIFANTLVDRIVTGYPKDEDEKIFNEFGYEDKLLVTGEPFALWVIESDKDFSSELTFEKAGLPVIFTDNCKPYKQRKVRILNGAHTSFVPVSFLAGNDFVKQSMDDKIIRDFMQCTIFDEVIPTLELPEQELKEFAEAVTERFLNPYIKHSLLAISLNGVSKWKARCLPSFTEYIRLKGSIPKHLAFSLASLAEFYSGSEIKEGTLIGKRGGEEYFIRDDMFVLEFFRDNSSLPSKELVKLFLEDERFWGCNLTAYENVLEMVSDYLEDIRVLGMRNALEKNFS